MRVDQYGLTSIASLYFDTPNCALIRRSCEKPEYKEKIRLRSYGLSNSNKPVYLELKRKVDGIVYKRRIETKENEVKRFLNYNIDLNNDGQIGKEITYFRNFYHDLKPKCLIIYDRLAYFDPNSDLRLTIDHNPRYRISNLNLNTSMDGDLLLNEGETILEIKVQAAMPLWLTKLLTDLKIYKTSFSKYGEAFRLNQDKLIKIGGYNYV